MIETRRRGVSPARKRSPALTASKAGADAVASVCRTIRRDHAAMNTRRSGAETQRILPAGQGESLPCLCHSGDGTRRVRAGFTLIELLIVVAIIAILAAIALVNFSLAKKRALQASDASNLHTIATALQTYLVDYGTLPPADREAGPFMSHGFGPLAIGNGPAAGGSWDGVPWLLYEYKYISNWQTLFCPKYLKEFQGGSTLRGDYPRFHNFRYAYNSSALSTGGHAGGDGALMSGTTWIVRDLWLPPQSGWYGRSYPHYPADYRYPWGEDVWTDKVEMALFGDLAVHMVVGGKNYAPENAPTPTPTPAGPRL